MRKIVLSSRMKAVADMVIPGGVVADIGCDHAFVSIYLVEHQIAPKVIASDVKIGPTSIALNNVKERKLEKQIEIRLGNGLGTLQPKEADTIIIAGLGGILMNQILEEQRQIALSVKQLVLQPQSDIGLIRKKLREMKAEIVREEMLVDMGKYYTIMDARLLDSECLSVRRNSQSVENINQELYDRYGRYLLENKHPVLFSYLQKEYEENKKTMDHLSKQSSDKAKQRLRELECEQRYIDKAFSYYK